ncbi:cation diffusion facilitator family transporter [Fulvivirgaceae bacterium PWU20]|uniref:Cation diffusion facilitator family transporter n=1 Tax=Chryseosolibacter indicus TaxID=2782351 RepID=A0ABS5VX62_9BACT|nr:cation diffusion facilitator family transporter [Chryseosolibacter indicus]MBT1705653.1 cation diffusion facilitator family transporter [Chryseosolibacter indicus]
MNAHVQNIKIQRWVLVLSVSLLFAKLVAYYLTHSVAILTDALEAIVNVVAGILGLYSLRLSAKPKDTDHPYGHGKVEFLSAATEGLMIIVAGVLIIIEAVAQLINPEPLHKLDIGMALIAITAIANYIMGTVSINTGKKNSSMALIASGTHLRTDTYSTIGLLAGLLLIYITNILWLDSVVAILFSFFILYTGLRIIRSSVAGIMDETDKVLLEQLVTKLNETRSKNWIDLHNLRIIKYGSTLHLDCHLTVPWYLNVHEAHDEVEKLGDIVRKKFDHSIELFVHSDGCLPTSCPICIKDDCPVRYHKHQRRIEWTVENIQTDKKHQVDT